MSSIDEEKSELDIQQEKMSRMIAAIAAGIYCLIGAFVYLKNIGYYEDGMISLMIGYFLCAVPLGLGIYKGFKFVWFPAVIVGLVLLVFSSNSFSWRKDYFKNSFLLIEYIDGYPSYTETLKARLFGGPRIVDFVDTCLSTPDLGKEVAHKAVFLDKCASIEKIEQNFALNIFEMLNSHYLKMKKTAEMIAQDKSQEIAYPVCVNRRHCAKIALPPSNLSEEEILTSKDPNVIVARDSFWELVDEIYITPNVCATMVLCRRLAELEILNAAKLGALQEYQSQRNEKLKKEKPAPSAPTEVTE